MLGCQFTVCCDRLLKSGQVVGPELTWKVSQILLKINLHYIVDKHLSPSLEQQWTKRMEGRTIVFPQCETKNTPQYHVTNSLKVKCFVNGMTKREHNM